jgi:hypothetical protein
MKKLIWFIGGIIIVGAVLLLLTHFNPFGNSDNKYASKSIPTTIKPYEIMRFDEDFLHINTSPNEIQNSLKKLQDKYGIFLDMYTIKLLGIGSTADPGTAANIRQFLSQEAYHAFYMAIDSVYKNGLSKESDEMTEGFNRFHYFFPKKPIPRRIIAINSGFYGNMAVEEENNDLALSLEFYLGADYKNYQWVDGIFDYMRPNLRREKLAPDALMGWTMYQFPEQATNIRLIDEIMYQGKIMYLTEAMLPKEDPMNLMGYTKDQWDWCKANEGQMWNYIKTYKHLYTYDRLVISKYVNPGPKTAFFPDGSPAKTGIWLGWQIVRSYMKNNPDVSLQALIDNNNSQQILEQSKYNPK